VAYQVTTWLKSMIHQLRYTVGTSLAVITNEHFWRSDYTINSILLSEGQAAQMCNLSRKL